MPHFSLHFDQDDVRNRSTSVIVEADDKHDAAKRENDARLVLPPGVWYYNGAVEIPPGHLDRLQASFATLDEEKP